MVEQKERLFCSTVAAHLHPILRGGWFMRNPRIRRTVLMTGAAVVVAASAVVEPTFAQVSRTTIEVDTTLLVRTTEAIDVKTADGLVFTGTIEEDVLDRNGDVAIAEGSTVELLARKAGDEMT